VRRTISIIDSHVGRLERALEVAADGEPRQRQRLLESFPERAGGAGIRSSELRGERSQLIERTGMVVVRPRSPQPLLHRRPLALGQVVEDIPLLVPDAPLHGCVAEDGADRLAERLGAVDHEQDPLLGVEAALDQIGEQRRGDGRVLGRAFPEPERDLHALGGDPERDDARPLAEVDPVDHHHR
jgi:hypothetical protein